MDEKERIDDLSAVLSYEVSIGRTVDNIVRTGDDGKPFSAISTEALHRYAEHCREWLRFGEDADEYSSGLGDEHSMLKVCSTPRIFLDMGFEQKPMLYTKQHLLDSLHPKSAENDHWHGLTMQQIKHWPELLQTPVLVADNPSRADSVLFVLEEVDSDKLPLLASVKPDGLGNYELSAIQTNMILTVFGKDDFAEYFSTLIADKGRLLYIDKNRSRNLERLCERQLFANYSGLGYNRILRTPAAIVNLGGKAPGLNNDEVDYSLVKQTDFASSEPHYVDAVAEADGFWWSPSKEIAFFARPSIDPGHVNLWNKVDAATLAVAAEGCTRFSEIAAALGRPDIKCTTLSAVARASDWEKPAQGTDEIEIWRKSVEGRIDLSAAQPAQDHQTERAAPSNEKKLQTTEKKTLAEKMIGFFNRDKQTARQDESRAQSQARGDDKKRPTRAAKRDQ